MGIARKFAKHLYVLAPGSIYLFFFSLCIQPEMWW